MFSTKILAAIFLSILAKTSLACAVGNKSPEGQLLASVTATYRSAGLAEMAVEKRITYEWKPKDDVSNGKIFYSHGKIRWEIDTPDKNWTICDEKTCWNIEFASKDFPDAKNKVTIAAINKKNKEQFFLLNLLNTKSPSDQFHIKSEESADGQVRLKLEPRKPTGYTDIFVTVKKAQRTIKEISFKDDIGNLVKLILDVPTIKSSGDAKLFKYKPDPKKDQVSNL